MSCSALRFSNELKSIIKPLLKKSKIYKVNHCKMTYNDVEKYAVHMLEVLSGVNDYLKVKRIIKLKRVKSMIHFRFKTWPNEKSDILNCFGPSFFIFNIQTILY